MVKVSKLAVDGPVVVSVPELLQQVDILVQLLHTTIRRKIRLIEGNAKCRHLKKIYMLRLCRWFRFAQLAKGKKFRP